MLLAHLPTLSNHIRLTVYLYVCLWPSSIPLDYNDLTDLTRANPEQWIRNNCEYLTQFNNKITLETSSSQLETTNQTAFSFQVPQNNKLSKYLYQSNLWPKDLACLSIFSTVIAHIIHNHIHHGLQRQQRAFLKEIYRDAMLMRIKIQFMILHHTLHHHVSGVNAVALNPEGDRLLSGGKSKLLTSPVIQLKISQVMMAISSFGISWRARRCKLSAVPSMVQSELLLGFPNSLA